MAGKTAMIMGGGSGIGKATAELFGAAGCNLMICGVPEQLCLDTAEELRAEGYNAIGMLCDGTKQDMIDATIEKTVDEFGSLDYVISTAAARKMKELGTKGKIVLVSSARGINAMENIALYSTTKSAVMGMVRALAVDFAPYGIQVNGIAPGYVMTPMVEKVFAEQPKQQEYVYSRTPSQVKMGSLEEMAMGIFFLCSPVTDYTTGQTLIMDGGWSIQ